MNGWKFLGWYQFGLHLIKLTFFSEELFFPKRTHPVAWHVILLSQNLYPLDLQQHCHCKASYQSAVRLYDIIMLCNIFIRTQFVGWQSVTAQLVDNAAGDNSTGCSCIKINYAWITFITILKVKWKFIGTSDPVGGQAVVQWKWRL